MKKSALVMGFDNSVIARESILLLINEGSVLFTSLTKE